MSATHNALAADPTTARVLVFGHSESGKTSLLGALLQAGETQGDLLGGEVVDLTRPPRLALIRDKVYHATDYVPGEGEFEVSLIRLNPWRKDGRPVADPLTVELLDCDGTAARRLMADPTSLAARKARGDLAAAVVGADAILLVVAAGSVDAQLRDEFGDFARFMTAVRDRRGYARAVGGFPIRLVVTGADRLARPGDTKGEWVDRVGEYRRGALAQLAGVLGDDSPAPGIQSPYLPFGRVVLIAQAVAIRWPPLADEVHRPDEPYGVAELFRGVFAAVREHRRRARSSDRRLWVTVWAVLFSLWLLVAGAMAVVYFQPPPADPGLADRVRGFELHEPPAAVRLADANIGRGQRQLKAFQADAGFFALPDDLRAFVDGRLREIADYQAYRAKLLAAPAPAEARTLDDLARTETALTTELALPAEYTWADTESGRVRDKWLADLPPIRAAEAAWHDWYRGLVSRAVGLSLTRGFDGDWRARVGGLLADADQPPFDVAAPLPGSEAEPLLRGGVVPYRVPFEFDRVYQARRDWDFARDRLTHLRDLADALALTAEPGRGVLSVPPPGPGVDPNRLPGDRLAAVRREFPRPSALYPGAADGYPEWELTNFPEPGRSVLAGRVRESFGNGVAHARRLIRDKLPADTPEGWAKVADGLGGSPDPDWGRLLRLLARLETPTATDPVAELTAFLRTKEFGLDLKGVEVTIPLALRVPTVVPAGPLTMTLTPRAGGEPAVKTFRAVGDGTQQGPNVVHRFAPNASPAFAYRPGDGLRAELPVRSGDQKFTLVWDAGTSKTYQLDRLGREPALVRDGSPPEPATGVTLSAAPGSTLPRVPELLR